MAIAQHSAFDVTVSMLIVDYNTEYSYDKNPMSKTQYCVGDVSHYITCQNNVF